MVKTPNPNRPRIRSTTNTRTPAHIRIFVALIRGWFILSQVVSRLTGIKLKQLTPMNIWSTREKSLAWLENELISEHDVLQKGFENLNRFVELFQEISNREGESRAGEFSRICGITLAKFSHLLLFRLTEIDLQ